MLIEDSRRNGRYLRTTWHAEGRMFVLSTWTDEVCTGAVRIPVERAPDLINLLTDGVGDALEAPAKPTGKAPSPTTAAIQQHLNEARSRFLRWLREPKQSK